MTNTTSSATVRQLLPRCGITDQDDEIIQEFAARRLGMVIIKDAAGRTISAHIPNPFVVDQPYELEIIDGE